LAHLPVAAHLRLQSRTTRVREAPDKILNLTDDKALATASPRF
jgi:hypothetical protein